MTHTYKTKGVCSRAIDFELTEDGIVREVKFHGGCDGNAQGVAKLCEGRRAEELIELLSGIRCGLKSTSCPDQLAKALRELLPETEEEAPAEQKA